LIPATQRCSSLRKRILKAKLPRRGRKRGERRTSLMRSANGYGLETEETIASPNAGSRRRARQQREPKWLCVVIFSDSATIHAFDVCPVGELAAFPVAAQPIVLAQLRLVRVRTR
jgi:hypothetical protein